MPRPFRRYNIQAVFEDHGRADEAASAVTSEVQADVTIGGPDSTAAVRAEMRDELEASVQGPGPIGPFTKSMSRGIAIWLPVATVIGALLGALIGLIPWGFTLPMRLLIGVSIGIFAGATVGFVVGGAFRPRTEAEGGAMAAERGVALGVHADTAEDLDRAETVLRRFGPERLDRVDAHGSPLGTGPQEQTRPIRGPIPTAPPEDEE